MGMFFSDSVLFGRFGNDLETLIYPPSSYSSSSGDDDLGNASSAANGSSNSGSSGGDGGIEQEGALFEAFREYLDEHITMVQSASSSLSSASLSSSSTLSDEKRQKTVVSVMERAVLEGH